MVPSQSSCFHGARLLRLLVCSFFASTTLFAFSQARMSEQRPDSRLAFPIRAVAPELKGEWVTQRSEFVVAITGTVDRYGVMKSPQLRPEPGAEPLALALQAVIGDWRYRAPVDDKECKTVDREQSAFFVYDNREGQGKLEMTRARQSQGGAIELSITGSSQDRTLSYFEYPYPKHAFAARMEGFVEMLVLIGPEGRVRHYDVLSERPEGQFAGDASRAVRSLRFQFEGEPPKEPQCRVLQIPYCLTSNVRYPDRACR